MADKRPLDELDQNELRQAVAEGDVTMDEVDTALQQSARRAAAESSPDELPPADHVTAGGFGSGQGMGTERTGQDPDRPDSQGFPRTAKDAEDWPH